MEASIEAYKFYHRHFEKKLSNVQQEPVREENFEVLENVLIKMEVLELPKLKNGWAVLKQLLGSLNTVILPR